MPMDDRDGAAALWAFSPHPQAGGHDDLSWAAWTRPRDRRMGALPPVRSQPVRDVRTITSLVAVAAALLDSELRGGSFSLEQLMKKMRELLRPGQTLSADDVRAVLPGMGQRLAATRDRWRWRHDAA